MSVPRLYNDLAWVWPLLHPPGDFAAEASEVVSALRAAGVREGGRILHLGCGAGSLDFHLKAHFQVTGVDLSAQMLGHARGVNPEIQYLLGDIRDARLNRTFDGVLLHDAQAYLTDARALQASYETAAAHLVPGGPLISIPQELRSRFQQHHVYAGVTVMDGNTTVTKIEVDFDPDPDDQTFEKTFVLLIRDARGQRIETDVHAMGLWDLVQMLAPMRAVGFVAEVSTPKLPDCEQGQWVLVTAKLQR